MADELSTRYVIGIQLTGIRSSKEGAERDKTQGTAKRARLSEDTETFIAPASFEGRFGVETNRDRERAFRHGYLQCYRIVAQKTD